MAVLVVALRQIIHDGNRNRNGGVGGVGCLGGGGAAIGGIEEIGGCEAEEGGGLVIEWSWWWKSLVLGGRGT